MQSTSEGGRTRPVRVDICLDENESISDTLKRLGLVCSNNKNNSYGISRVFLDCGDENDTPPVRDVAMKRCSNVQNGSVILV